MSQRPGWLTSHALAGVAALALLCPAGCHEEDPSADNRPGRDLGDASAELGPTDAGRDRADTGHDGGLDAARASDAGPQDSGPRTDGSPDALPDATGDAQTADSGAPLPCPDALALGKLRLAQAQAHDALRVFEAGLLQCPGDPDLRFGAALAGSIDAAELTAMILSIAGQISNYEVGRNEFIAESLHTEMMRLRQEWLTALGHANLLDPQDVDFEVEAAWVYLGLQPNVVYRGVFDGGDLHLLRATVVEVVAAQDWRADLLGLLQELRGGLGGINFATIGRILGTLLLGEAGTFFDLHPADGAAIFAVGPEHLAAVGREIGAGLRWMVAHHAEQDERPQVSWVEPLRPGASLDDGVRVVMNATVRVDPDTGERVEDELRAEFSPELEATFLKVSSSFAQPGALVPFREEVLPILASILQVALQYGLLSSVVDSLPIDPRVLDHAGITQALDLFLPLPVALDPGTFFVEPAGLRVVLPQVEDGSPPRFVAEWECLADLDEAGYPSGSLRMLCGEEAELSDLPHFLGEPWETEADGWLARTPYLRWDDPTLNGLLWVDQEAIELAAPDAPGRFAPATLRTLNAAVAVGLAPLLNLLGQAN